MKQADRSMALKCPSARVGSFSRTVPSRIKVEIKCALVKVPQYAKVQAISSKLH